MDYARFIEMLLNGGQLERRPHPGAAHGRDDADQPRQPGGPQDDGRRGPAGASEFQVVMDAAAAGEP